MLLIGRFNWSILLFPFCICLMVSLRSLRCCFLAPVLPFGEVPKSSDWLLLDILPMHSYRRLGVYLRSSSNLSSTHFFSPFVGTHSQSTLEVGRASSVAFWVRVGPTKNLAQNHSKIQKFFAFVMLICSFLFYINQLF